MSRALTLAEQGLGRVAPNPSVGCVIVREDKIIAEARTADGGRPHAEALALISAGDHARSATAYISLEPCESCAGKLVAAGIAKAVIGCRDQNPSINGKGIAALRAAGMEVEEGCLQTECADLNRGFFLTRVEGRPLITLKTATSLDSKIATASGESKWITGEDARAYSHVLRSRHDAILTGIGTVLADDPELTTRIDGVDHKSVRIVLDNGLRIPSSARMLNTKDCGEIIVFTNENSDAGKIDELEKAGVTIIRTPEKIEPAFVLETLAARGITRLMVEAGQGVLTSFLKSRLWDDLYIMRAPLLLGADGRDAFGPLGLDYLGQSPRLTLISREPCGTDLVEYYRRTA